MMAERDFDVTLYGASGFTGRQTAAYFAALRPPHELRWAIAGRNREKLEAVKQSIGEGGRDVEILVADGGDQKSLDAIAQRTRVMLTTAGPFAIYGTALVDACVRSKTNYVDITGETPWVRGLIDRYHEQAAADGTRIIPFCGFDSVPSDLGTYLLVRSVQSLGLESKGVKAYFQVRGGLNGGTMATMFNLYDAGQYQRARELFLLNPSSRPSSRETEQSSDPTQPRYDREIKAWVGPFVMGTINTRVVRRSQALFDQWGASYGSEFFYQEYAKFGGTLGWAPAIGMTLGMGVLELMLQTPARSLIQRLAPQPGAGPSEHTMNNGWFQCELLSQTDSGRIVRGLIRDQGDPGNRATVKILCEAALCLTQPPETLPGGVRRGGVLTPATGLGDMLADRLRNAGMTLEVSV
jgi:short subunit dehydrogenase-like uncharacterized protein